MKKSFIILALLFSHILISCGGDDEPSNDPKVVDLTNALLTEDGYYDGGQLYYQIIDQNNVRVSKSVKNCQVVEVPEKVKINDKIYTVTELGISSFFDQDELTSITLPETLKNIAKYALKDCDRIESIILPNSVETIGYSAISYCDKLKNITISKSLKEVGDYAFDDDNALENIYISDLKAWCQINYESNKADLPKHHLILNGKEIIDLEIPNSVNAIAHHTFSGCQYIKSMRIPNSVTSIGHPIFISNNLNSVTIPERFKDELKQIFGDTSKISFTFI